jgi:two-component system, NtrC family, sensor kinase
MSRMPRISNLGVKLTLSLILCLLGVFAALGWQTVRLHRKHLEEMTFSSADRISDTIRRSTRYSMLKNHRDEVYQIINTIGTEPGIGTIRIFNQDGKVSFSTDVREVGRLVDKKAEACTACHAQEEPLTRLNRPDKQRIYAASDGTRLLGLISPIENEPSCATAECHAHPPSQQVLGVLDVTLSLAQVDESIAQSSGRMLAVFAAAMLIVPIFVGVPIWYLIHRPIRQLTLRTQRIAAGKLDGEILITSRDEIGELAASFNHMTQELNRANVQITEWNRTLENRVAQKTQELKRATEQMVQVERMASIGKLAAIVAHEVNNPLTGILTYAKLLLKKTKSNGEGFAGMADAQQYLEVIASESARCGELVKGLLQFARQSPVHLREHDVNELIRQAVRLVQHKMDLMNLQLRLQLQEAPPPLICDAQLIKQALVALLINACEAVTLGEGVIEVESRCNPETNTVDVLVRDNGFGMDEDVQRHIFEPFFTTKEAGKGVGLGLAVVYGIVSQHSGTIEVRSRPGEGTTVALRLPAQERGVEGEAVRASKGEP